MAHKMKKDKSNTSVGLLNIPIHLHQRFIRKILGMTQIKTSLRHQQLH